MHKISHYLKIRNWGLFIKLFIPLLLALIIPFAAVSIINYNVSTRNLEAEVGQSNLSTLKQTNVAIDTILQTTEKMQYHLIRYPDIQLFLDQNLNISVFDDINIIKKVMQTTEVYMDGSPFISDIYFFSSSNRLLVSANTGIYRKMTDQDLRSMERLTDSDNGTKWLTPYEPGAFDEKIENVQLLKFFYKGKGQVNGFIDIQLNNKELLRLVEEIYIRKSGYITVLDENGKVVLNKKGKDDILGFTNQTPWLNESEGSIKLGGRDHREWLVTYTTSPYNGWKYVATVPVDELENKSSLIRSNILLMCLFFAVVAVIVSLGTATGLYSPIKSIQGILRGTKVNERNLRNLLLRKDELGQINEAIREISAVKEQWEKSLPELKQHVLYRLAANDSSVRKDLERYADFFGLPLSSDYLVILGLFEQSPMNESRQAILSEFTVCFEEWTVVAEATAFFEQNDRLVGFIRFHDMNESAPEFIGELKGRSLVFRDNILNQHTLKIAIAVGNPCPGLVRLHESYQEAANALKYRFVQGTDAVILSREIEENPADHPVKFDYFNYIKNALEAARYDQAAEIVRELRGYMKSNHYLTEGYVFHYRNIVNTLVRHLQVMHPGYSEYAEELQRKFIHFEREFASVDEATDWLCSLLGQMGTERSDRLRLHKVVKKAIDIIELEYDKDPSLVDLADRLEVTSTYLSRLFKEELGKNFKEYLTEFKIGKAKRLLAETDLPIETIARQVGYQNHNQFARMFKRYEQVSAMEYRNRIKQA